MGMPRSEVENLITTALPGAQVEATDLTGTQDHWSVLVIWEGFEGLKLFEQHKKVMQVFTPHLEATTGGPIHAVEIRTAASL